MIALNIIKKSLVEKDYQGTIALDKFNSRLKVISFKGTNLHSFITEITKVASTNQLDKIIFYAKKEYQELLPQIGFMLEGTIPKFFCGEDCYCFSLFTNAERRLSPYLEQENKIIADLNNSKKNYVEVVLPSNFNISAASTLDIPQLVALYRKIFTTYPSPLLDEDYVRSVINVSTYFMCIFEDDKLVSAASAEVDGANCNAEITDCATHPDYRGQGLLTKLIIALENEMKGQGVHVLYSLARAGSYGMNAALHKLSYRYTGRMINNCHIDGRFEDMNIWAKV